MSLAYEKKNKKVKIMFLGDRSQIKHMYEVKILVIVNVHYVYDYNVQYFWTLV